MSLIQKDKIVDQAKLVKLINERKEEGEILGGLSYLVAEYLGANVNARGETARYRFLENGLEIEYWPEHFRVSVKLQNETVLLEEDHIALEYHRNPRVTKIIEDYYKQALVLKEDKAREEIIEETVKKCHTWDIDPREVLR